MNEIEDLKKSIDIPEELDLAINLGLERGRKERTGKKISLFKSKRIKKVAVAAGIVMVTAIGLGLRFPAYAEEIPGIGQVVGYISKTFGVNGYDNAEKISYSAYADGYTINVENIYYDGDELTVFYNVKGEKPLDPSKAYWFQGNINYHKGLQYEYGMEKGNLIDEYTFGGMIKYYAKPHDGSKLPKIFKGEFDIKKILIGFGNTEEIEINKKPIKLNLNSENLKIEEYSIGKEIESHGNTIELLKLYKYPNKIAIDTKYKVNNENRELNYYLWDTKKGILEFVSGSDKEDNILSIKHGLPSKDGEVFIIPETSDNHIQKENVEIEGKLVEMGKKYDFGNRGTVEIEDIKQGENETFITIKTTGEQSRVKLNIFEEGTTGSFYIPKYEVEKEIQGLLEQRVKYAYPKLDLNKKYYIEVVNRNDDYTILKDQIIKLDIK
ncbi:DUF4179 domain-containing protein [Clostridium hydrogeniformans]|uniref:DUF4179 domain-containing protein n=1 Tax=Clostridium hydrogeniformans TaxID=349933 RepID=UPI0004808E5E|nr:DUF4179 domain-containing protein [Clostridium hydrogeniformans]